eukprot:CAMPEP_0197052172 /NCGR_PEP_ID=MMETSP1384-20130603/26688_1 /TAXON_ID=29189 /ORGANISM="Ammonia sp." /LENGTH=77 /DNA_ID=CAMNT_0042484835 /DNA_START=154 /DNA_END=383 /DNA_ORIENTATION=+
MNQRDELNFINKLLKWECPALDVKVLNMRVFHNVRYATMPGFAFIELQNNAMAQTLVTHFQEQWTKNRRFKYWIDFL